MDFYTFGLGADLQHPTADLLGGKGAGLMLMSSKGIPVPPGFTIPTMVWAEYDKKPKTTMKAIEKALPAYLAKLTKHFGYLPLLSVRSGSRVSCPGMMDTILNVGMDASETLDGGGPWIHRLGPVCFNDSLTSLITMYGSVVKGIRKELLETEDPIGAYHTETGEAFPDAKTQLLNAIEAVFKSWDNDRALVYRRKNAIPREWGTAVTIQAMVFGNLNAQSGTGVLFTRNPNTGAQAVTGEFLQQAQGEGIVAGTRTPLPLAAMQTWNPVVYDQLLSVALTLETFQTDMQDIEFTVQDGVLYLLQTRHAKRSATAAIRIALDMVNAGLIDAATGLSRISVTQFDLAQASHLDSSFEKQAAFTGISACPGVVTGKPVFTKADALACKEPCILVTQDTTPDDIEGMYAAKGIITMVGGLTSHAAVNARGMNKPCIVGVGQNVSMFQEVEVLSMDAATGRIWTEAIPIIHGETNGLISELTQLIFATLQVVPVVTDVPKYPLDQALLYLGDQVLHPTDAVQLVEQVSLKVKTLYLDLTPAPGTPEADYLAMFGDQDFIGVVLDRLGETTIPKDQLIIVGGGHQHPFKAVGTPTDLRSVVLAEELVLDAPVTDPAVQKVVAWKVSDGVKVISLGTYVPGSKSMLSVEQALPLVLKGGE